jgi:FlaA1/EpsC-like NDP-sugar epimerase
LKYVAGKRILVIGGAGSIGAATVKELVRFGPESLHVVDLNENNLAELVRDLRSGCQKFIVPDFRALPVDFGSPIMQRYLIEQPSFDIVLNFAAVKHVRSEKDVYSLLQMLDVNVLKVARFFKWIEERGGNQVFFSVSTDKAANPVNLMGASKRLMEHVIFSHAVAPSYQGRLASARFANVAFSDGSLLYAWLRRLEKLQPLAAPRATRRFFISLSEAAQICLLAAFCAPDRHLLIPKLAYEDDLRDIQSIAVEFIKSNGYLPRYYENEEESKLMLQSDMANGYYPILLTSLDTVGEKPYEEFVGKEEQVVELGMDALCGIPYKICPKQNLLQFLLKAEEWINTPTDQLTKKMIIEAISSIVFELSHSESDKALDDRM